MKFKISRLGCSQSKSRFPVLIYVQTPSLGSLCVDISAHLGCSPLCSEMLWACRQNRSAGQRTFVTFRTKEGTSTLWSWKLTEGASKLLQKSTSVVLGTRSWESKEKGAPEPSSRDGVLAFIGSFCLHEASTAARSFCFSPLLCSMKVILMHRLNAWKLLQVPFSQLQGRLGK